MSDEIIDSGSPVDSGTTDVVDSGSSGVDTSSADLQSKMLSGEDYYFSDDINGYYKPNGEPLLNSKGDYVRSKEELDSIIGTQTAKTPQIQNPTSNANTNIFEGQFDPQKSTGFFRGLMKNSTGYRSSLNVQQPKQEIPAQTDASQQPGQSQQQTAEQQKLDIVTQVNEYQQNLRQYALSPLTRAAKAMQAAGVWNDDNPEAVALHQEIQDTEKNISDLAGRKQVELIQKYIDENNTAKQTEEENKQMQIAIQRSRFNVAKDFGGENNLDWLLVGKEVNNNGKQGFVRGPGADIIEALVDIIHDGKEVTDLGKAYADVFNKIQKNEQALRIVANAATAIWLANNISKNNDAVRKQTLEAERNRRRNVSLPASANQHVNIEYNGMPAEVARMAGMSTV